MYSLRYYDDRVEEYQPPVEDVSDKIRAIVERSPVGLKQPLFVSENGYIPLGVAKNLIMRHRSLWGRYQ